MRRPSSLFFWSLLVTGSRALWQTNVRIALDTDSGTYLHPPSGDPWYSAPDGWEATAPGTVLKVREHAYNMTPIAIANVKDTFQVLFRTTNSLGNATWAVTTAFIPTQQ